MTNDYDDDYLWNTGNSSRLDAVRSSLPDVVTSGETIIHHGQPRFKSPQRITCPRCGEKLRRGVTMLAFKHGSEETREQTVEGWICGCGEAYVPGATAMKAYRRAMGPETDDELPENPETTVSGACAPMVAVGTRFRTGDKCPCSGLYEFDCYSNGSGFPAPNAAERQIALSHGERFPPIRSTRANCWWKLAERSS